MEDDGKMQEHVGSILDIMEEHGGKWWKASEKCGNWFEQSPNFGNGGVEIHPHPASRDDVSAWMRLLGNK